MNAQRRGASIEHEEKEGNERNGYTPLHPLHNPLPLHLRLLASLPSILIVAGEIRIVPRIAPFIIILSLCPTPSAPLPSSLSSLANVFLIGDFFGGAAAGV